jgi:hypothetical protein
MRRLRHGVTEAEYTGELKRNKELRSRVRRGGKRKVKWWP